VIDLCSHLLHGLDDGPADFAGALAIARAAVAAGTETIVATPRIDTIHGVDPRSVHIAVESLRVRLAHEGIPLDVRAGGEIALDRLRQLSGVELDLLRLGGSRYLLIESPHDAHAAALEEAVLDLRARGYGVVLAHPERSPSLLRQPARVRRLVEAGALCSIASGSLSGYFGSAVRSFAIQLLREGLVHDVASDAHDDHRCSPDLLGGLAAAEPDLPGLSTQVDWLTRAAPAAILAGRPLPPRPELPRRRWRDRLR
jgi:protein-tyrosine phosphatase